MKPLMSASADSVVQRVDALAGTMESLKLAMDAQFTKVDSKIDRVRADLEKQLEELKKESDETRRLAQSAADQASGPDGTPWPSAQGAAKKSRKSESVPPSGTSRKVLTDEDRKTQCTVLVSGFPDGTYAKEIKDFLKAELPQEEWKYQQAYTKGFHTKSGYLEFSSPDDRRSFLLKMRGANGGAPVRVSFTDHDQSTHPIYINPQLPKHESRRQMVQRRIKKVILTAAGGGLTKEDVGIERGRGEVWIKRTLIATVESQGENWDITEAVTQYGLNRTELKSKLVESLAEQ